MITQRPQRFATERLPSDWHPLVRTIYAGRVADSSEISKHLKHLSPFSALSDVDKAVMRLRQAIDRQESVLIYGDYDVDGATATALCVRVLKLLGARVEWFVPQRERHGYGLSVKGLADLAQAPDLIITVDNGIRAHEAVQEANALGIEVIITDHHLPDKTLPAALAVVNPNREDCTFAGKNLAGVGVAFYVLMALRESLLADGLWPSDLRLSDYLDLVALGTVADVVALDHDNRILVNHGLQRLRSGKANLGVLALCAVANLNPMFVTAQDIAFAIAPRLNAVGRLGAMADGVALLLSEDWVTTQDYASQCDEYNRDRKMLENTMQQQALGVLDAEQMVICVHQADWHEGVLGIVASRLASRYARPVMVATDCADNRRIKASLRSVKGVALDALLAEAAQAIPAQAISYGGHEMAAGLTVDKSAWQALVKALQQAFLTQIGQEAPKQPIYIDGELPTELLQVDWARYLEQLEPWGAAMPAPAFANVFELLEHRILGRQHSRLTLREPYSGQVVQAMWFFHQVDAALTGLVQVVYEMQVNRFHGDERLSLLVRELRPFERNHTLQYA